MKTKQQLLAELLTTCLELNDENFTVFFDYAGHINRVDIRLHQTGWKSQADWDYQWGIYTYGEFNAKKMPINHRPTTPTKSRINRRT